MRVLDIIAGAAFVSGLIALPFTFYSFRRRPIRSVLLFGIPALIFFAACDTSQRISQANVLDELDALTEKYRIVINGASAQNPKEVLSALKTLQWLPDHHSNPTKRINVEIFDSSGQIVLWLDRHSGNPREYWIFYPRHYITGYNEIGKIVTPVFDDYVK